ncbi:MAG: glycosyltransferase family 2 protein [Polyangiales bacterium]
MLSVVVPMWNERAYVRRLVAEVLRVGDLLERDGHTRELELVLVDDASTDGTSEIARALSVADPRVRLLLHRRNRSLGAALRTGFAAARGDVVLYADADLPFDLHEIPRAMRLMALHDADVLTAFRLDRTSEGLRRIAYSWLYNRIVRSAFGIEVRDINFSFKMIRRAVLDALDLRSEGSFIDAELLVRAHRMGFRTIQLGVDYFPRQLGSSKLSSPRVIARMLTEMASQWPELRALGRERPT